MKQFFKGINKALDLLFRALETYSKIVLVATVVIVTAQVIARKVLHSSIIWSEEVALVLMVWMAFISMAIGTAKNIHIRIEMFYKKFPPAVQKVTNWAEYAVTLFVGYVLMVNGYKLVMATLRSTLPTTKWPSFVLYLMIPVAGFYVIYCTILNAFFPKAAAIFQDPEEEEAV